MYRSPPNLRSGTKSKPVPLSAADKTKIEESLSSPSTPTEFKVRTMPPKDKPEVIDTAYIEKCVSNYLSGHSVIDDIISKLSDKIREVVETAVRTAMTAANEELASLRSEVTKLTGRLQEVECKLGDRTDELEQYQRRNNLRIFGLAETQDEDTDQLVLKMCRDKLDIDLPVTAVCRSHRVGRQPEPAPDGRSRHRPIIVRFTSYRERRRVFDAKKRLKGSGFTIKEDLTSRRLEVLQKAASYFGPRNAWTRDGRVLWVDQNGTRGAATRLVDLKPPLAT